VVVHGEQRSRLHQADFHLTQRGRMHARREWRRGGRERHARVDGAGRAPRGGSGGGTPKRAARAWTGGAASARRD
jgi:hypothetical protein